MRRAWIVALLSAGLAVHAAGADHPLKPDQAELLEAARRYALSYSSSLPDFLCDQIVHRSEDARGDGRWRQIDTLKIKVTYFGHHEEYKLMEVNQRPTVLDYRLLAGTVSTGEFGTQLLAVFAKGSHAEFGWKGWSHIGGRRGGVFTYRIAQEHSGYAVQFGAISAGPNMAVIGYHGEIAVDPESDAVLRVSLTGDMPPHFGITACASWVEYDYRDVAGNSYLVPVTAETSLASGRYKSANKIEFLEYRKFQTDATITFK
jgi:hypothetical protein